jgi:hypothetical protein
MPSFTTTTLTLRVISSSYCSIVRLHRVSDHTHKNLLLNGFEPYLVRDIHDFLIKRG